MPACDANPSHRSLTYLSYCARPLDTTPSPILASGDHRGCLSPCHLRSPRPSHRLTQRPFRPSPQSPSQPFSRLALWLVWLPAPPIPWPLSLRVLSPLASLVAIFAESAQTCPDCGGKMKSQAEDVAAQFEYMPASFRMLRHGDPSWPAHAAITSRRRQRRIARSNAVSPARRCSRTCSSRRSPIIFRCIGSRTCTPVRASSSITRCSRSGSADMDIVNAMPIRS